MAQSEQQEEVERGDSSLHTKSARHFGKRN